MMKIFISYTHSDKESAQRLARELRQAGMEAWINTERIRPGERWEESIRRAIRESDYFIALISSGSLSRGYFQEELGIAMTTWKERPERSNFILPVRLDNFIPPALTDLQWIDFFPSRESGLNRLLTTIKQSDTSRETRKLSSREMEILGLIASGLKNKEIALRLSVTVQTVRMYVAQIMVKLGVESRLGAIRYAYEKGWLLEQPRITQNYPEEARLPAEVGSPTILIAWDPEILGQAEYIELLTALADLVRSEGGISIKRLDSEELEVSSEIGVLA